MNDQKNLKNILFNKNLAVMLKPYYIAFLIILMMISVYHLIFARRLIPGVFIAGIRLGGMNYNQAINSLIEYEKLNEKKLKLTAEGKEYEFTGEEIGLVYNWEAAVNRAFEVGRTGNFWVDTKDKLAGIFKNLYIPAYYDFDDTKFNNFLASIKGELNIPPKDAFFYIKSSNELAIQNEHIGQQIDDQALYESLIRSFDIYNFSDKKIIVEEQKPNIITSDIQNYLEEAQKIIFSPIAFIHEKNKWQLTNEQKLEFLIYDLEDKELEIDKVNLRTFLEGISPNINKLPRGRVEIDNDGKVTNFSLIQDGVELDYDATMQNFKTAFFELRPEAVVKTLSINKTTSLKDYGIYALLGEGKSKYTGSASGRIHNLTLAAERTDGVLVPPGGIYSFNDTIGEVSAATGYNAAWVIMGNKTVLGHGGGVCQTSTTMFRAALNAGLPIITRHPHAYRVGYYEIESPIGIDASVYQPSLDLEFKNDTPNYILIQLYQNTDENLLSFKIFGTPDGRRVEITEPVISSQSAPPPPLYQDDPTLAKGIIKQIDFAAGGANVSFTRKVTKNGEILYNDTFKTNYQPWRAIFLVGTKE